MIPFAIALLGFTFLVWYVVESLYIDPKSKIPGPKSYALTGWRLAYDDWQATRTRTIHRLHQQYGPVVRIGPNEVHFNSLAALRKIYGAGSGFERTSFYRMFEVYGRQNLFTFYTTAQHGERKKLLANAYSKSAVLHGAAAQDLAEDVHHYMELLSKLGGEENDVFKTLHYFSLDGITNFLYGPQLGGTSATSGDTAHRALLDDVFASSRRKLTWFAVHLPKLTKWLYTRSGLLEALVQPLLPMQKPSTYTAVRAHALQAMKNTRSALDSGRLHTEELSGTIIGKLFTHQTAAVKSGPRAGLDDLDIASECADHLLAGIDTTADTLMFLFWAISLPENKHIQEKLAVEVQKANGDLDKHENLTPAATGKLPYLDAVIKETLRLYAPLPASEPRCFPYGETVIDGYTIPAGTIVSMSPYSLHRNEDAFPDPLKFDPERWTGVRDDTAAKWFWAFSSGGRMCIGLHLAMAKMTTLVSAVYRQYSTTIAPGFENTSPAVTSRFELFIDETQPQIAQHKCMLKFERNNIIDD
ncbi:hypothetical protein LTR36_001305 [Oleoguttula mirabilis]|uniref:Cytochrome P450 n=1 Tax=Oleoguttula mirabilis TaxID=1507867 RepID=A0AAV9JNY0_9PEZI|nr:hypothetical protein LTR36_001305 [Oleoguttula mirabilis]